MYYRARYYDPVMGRFISEDPIAGSLSDPLSLNPYPYVKNNALNLTDPSGETVYVLIAAGTNPIGLIILGGVAIVGVGYLAYLEYNANRGNTSSFVNFTCPTDSNSEKSGNEKKEDLLPKTGDKTFKPKKTKSKDIPKDRSGGYVDTKGNSWQWDPRKGEWDVQHPDGSHTNVGPDGNVTHGPDNF